MISKPHSDRRDPEVGRAIREVAAVRPVESAVIARELDRLLGLEEQLEALREWSERALADFNAQLDKAPPNVLPHMGELADLVNSYPASEPKEDE